MRITITRFDIDHSINIPDDEVTLTEVLCLMGGLLRSSGFSFEGEFSIDRGKDSDDPDAQREEGE